LIILDFGIRFGFREIQLLGFVCWNHREYRCYLSAEVY